MAKKIIIAGATGLIGANLCKALKERGDLISVLTRDPAKGEKIIPFAENIYEWDPGTQKDYSAFLEGADAVINLSGAPVIGPKWTEAYKKEILESRINSARVLVDSMAKCKNKPKVFVCSSAVGYYGDMKTEVITEKTPAGKDFLADVCRLWEEEAAKAEKYGIRHVSVRTGIVLEKKGGALAKMVLPFRLFVGGSLASGEQWFSWIHWRDLCNIYVFAMDNDKINGPLNATAPIAETMKQFAKILGSVLNRPALFNVPEFVLKLLLGEGVSAIIASQRVIPAVLNKAGFKFEFIKAEDALKDILK